MVPVLSLSTLLRLQVASKGNFPKRALRCVHFPGLSCSGSGSPQRHSLGWACILCPSQVSGAQATRCLESTLSQVCSGSYHLSGPSRSVYWVCRKSTVTGVLCVSSWGLISGCNPPGRCQPSNIPGIRGLQLGACSHFGGGCHLWGQSCPRLPALAVACLPLCLRCGGGAGRQPASSPLAFDQSFVL